ncbi:MAG: alpha/beta fold hydrolase [Bacteroidales bacterium]
MKTLNFNEKRIAYQIEGEGTPVALLHGYLETMEVWDEMAIQLSQYFSVIRLDLPGHGKSDVYGDTHSMEFMADAVKHVLESEGYKSCFLIGHSLGGYVALAFLEKYPEFLRGLSLFHSHPFADTEEVKSNRKREIDLVLEGQKEKIISTNIPKLFADFNLPKFVDKVDKMKQKALQIPGEGIIANLNGMMQRPGRYELLKQSMKPFLLIAGKWDKYIDYDKIISQIVLPENGKLVTLEHSGHLGFVEEREKAFKAIYNFAENNF